MLNSHIEKTNQAFEFPDLGWNGLLSLWDGNAGQVAHLGNGL